MCLYILPPDRETGLLLLLLFLFRRCDKLILPTRVIIKEIIQDILNTFFLSLNRLFLWSFLFTLVPAFFTTLMLMLLDDITSMIVRWFLQTILQNNLSTNNIYIAIVLPYISQYLHPQAIS